MTTQAETWCDTFKLFISTFILSTSIIPDTLYAIEIPACRNSLLMRFSYVCNQAGWSYWEPRETEMSYPGNSGRELTISLWSRAYDQGDESTVPSFDRGNPLISGVTVQIFRVLSIQSWAISEPVRLSNLADWWFIKTVEILE